MPIKSMFSRVAIAAAIPKSRLERLLLKQLPRVVTLRGDENEGFISIRRIFCLGKLGFLLLPLIMTAMALDMILHGGWVIVGLLFFPVILASWVWFLECTRSIIVAIEWNPRGIIVATTSETLPFRWSEVEEVHIDALKSGARSGLPACIRVQSTGPLTIDLDITMFSEETFAMIIAALETHCADRLRYFEMPRRTRRPVIR